MWDLLQLNWAKVSIILFITGVLGLLCLGANIAVAEDIHEKVRQGKRKAVRGILEKEPEKIEDRTVKGQTPLHLAVRSAQKQVVAMLLQRGAKINVRDREGQTPLFYACVPPGRGPWEDIVDLLLTHGADPTIANDLGRGPLSMIAGMPSFVGNAEMAKRIANSLLSNGAEVNRQDYRGDTPLHVAAGVGLVPVVKVLLQHGSDPTIWNKEGQTPLRYACGSELLEQRIGKVVSAFRRNMKVEPIHNAAAEDKTTKVEELLQRSPELVSQKDPAGWTPLQWAIWNQANDAARLLLDSGAKVNAEGAGELRPIDLAACRGFPGLATMLVRNGAFCTGSGSDGWTALHFAGHWGSPKVAEILLNNDAYVNARDDWCYTPLCRAARMGRVDVSKVLIAHGAEVNVRGKHGQTALHFAAWQNVPDLVRILIEAGANVHARDRLGITPLYDAIRDAQNPEIVGLLLENGAEPNPANKRGRRALSFADSPKTVELCLEAGGDVNAAGQEGMTALHWAVQWGKKKVVRALLDAGADTTKKRNDGKTPMDLARQAGEKGMIQILSEADAE